MEIKGIRRVEREFILPILLASMKSNPFGKGVIVIDYGCSRREVISNNV